MEPVWERVRWNQGEEGGMEPRERRVGWNQGGEGWDGT